MQLFRSIHLMTTVTIFSVISTSRRACVASAFAGIRSVRPTPPQPRRQTPASRALSSRSTPDSLSIPLFLQSRISSLFSTVEEEVDPGVVEGTDLVILKYPHPALRTPNAEIPMEELTGPGSEISRIVKEMFLVMYACNGMGLAAPQVGINKRLLVYNESGDPKKWMQEVVLINPKVVEASEATDIKLEGCLSFPDMHGAVERPKWIKIEAQNLKGKTIKKKFTGWDARIFLHEYDHLDGVLHIDRMIQKDRKEIQPKLDKLVANFGDGGAL